MLDFVGLPAGWLDHLRNAQQGAFLRPYVSCCGVTFKPDFGLSGGVSSLAPATSLARHLPGMSVIKCSHATQPLGPPCTVIPVLIYPDPGAAADWVSKAFGFTIRLRIANHRIQMKAGDGCFTIAEGKVAPNNSHIIQVRIEDAEGHCERARQNGAIILTEPKDQPLRGAPIQRSGLLWPSLGLHSNYRRRRPGRMEWRCVSSGMIQSQLLLLHLGLQHWRER